jgi:glucokinase
VNASLTIGVDIGGTNLRLGAVRDGIIERVVVRPSRLTPAELSAPEDVLAGLIAQVAEGEVIDGIGVAATGPIDHAARRIVNPHNLPDWSGDDWARRLERATGVPVVLENDAAGAALGEFEQGAGVGADVLAMVTLGTGIGVVDRVTGIWRGADDQHPEAGHVPIADDAEACYCGVYGCWEQLCAGAAIRTRWTRSDGKVDWVGYGRMLARGLRTVARTFGPDRILIGGGIAANFSDFSVALAEEFDRDDPMGRPVSITPAQLPYPAVIGAASAVRRHRTSHPQP